MKMTKGLPTHCTAKTASVAIKDSTSRHPAAPIQQAFFDMVCPWQMCSTLHFRNLNPVNVTIESFSFSHPSVSLHMDGIFTPQAPGMGPSEHFLSMVSLER